jgi:hypothetical protein
MSKATIVGILVVLSIIGLVYNKCSGVEEKEKAEAQRIESLKMDKSNYKEKTLRWFEANGGSRGYDYHHNPDLIKINNAHVVDIPDSLISDGTNSGPVTFYSDSNILNELKDLYSRDAHFNAYCEIKAGMLDILMLEY